MIIRCNNCFQEYEENDAQMCPECGYVQGSSAKEAFHLDPGTELLDRYIVGEVLGFGGFGITYRSWDKKLSRLVAIKEYYPSGIVNRSPGTKDVIIYAQKRKKEYEYGKERFLDEARNMAKFNSEPNIINVFEYFEENNTAYIVMEFLNGISLSAYLRTNQDKMDVDTGIEIAEAVGNALHTIHGKGIIHRDVSPDNIFLCLGGGIKLIDFGAARFSQDESRLMTIILKPGFAPPEQYDKVNKQGAWTDVYALGATLYYIITGVKPEESTNRKINDTMPSPRELNDEITENLSNAIMKAMAVDFHMRYQNVEEFLNAIHSNRRIKTIKEEKRARNRKRILSICGAAVVIIGGITASIFGWENEKENETLPDCTLKIWYCKSGDQELDDAKKNAYENVISDFQSSFPNVQIELEGFEKNEYKEKFLYSDEKATLFEYVDGITGQGTLDLKEVYDSKPAKNCSILKEADKFFGNTYYLPMGYNISVVYVNTVMNDITVNAISSMDEIGVQNNGIVTDNEHFKEMFPAASDCYSDRALEQFVSGDAECYVSMTDKYYDVAEKMPAQYRVVRCDTDPVYCKYENVLAGNDIGKDENKTSIRFLEFMLNNNAQDTLHIQNQNRSLPVNDAVLEEYAVIYGDFEEVLTNKENYVFEEGIT